MTIEEARDVCNTIVSAEINELCNLYRHDDAQELEEAKNLMLSAFEKQIPKKPKDETKSFAYCPHCCGSVFKANIREHIEGNEITFCEHCGQALDWGEE